MREWQLAGILIIFSVVRSVCLCLEDPAVWVDLTKGRWSRSLQLWDFDRLPAHLSSVPNLEVHDGNNKALRRLMRGEVKEKKNICDKVDVTNCGKWGWFKNVVRIVSWLLWKEKKVLFRSLSCTVHQNPSQRQHGIVFEHRESRASLHGFRSWLCHFLALWLYSSYLTSLWEDISLLSHL